jgi:flagellar hook-length control protein FliK
VSTAPTDLVQPVSAVARATSPQAGAQSSGDASPFEAFLGAGATPPSQTLSRPSQSSRVGPTGQNTTPTTAANHQQTPGATPGPQQPPAPSHGSTGGSSARSRLTPGPNPQPGTAADGTGSTATKLPIPPLTDPAGANASTIGEPMIAGSNSAALDDPILATPVHKSDKASSGKAGEASTPSLAAPPRAGSVASQGSGPTIIAAPAASPSAPAAAAPTPQTGVAGTAVVSVTAPPPRAAFAASAPTPIQLVPEPSSLQLDPTTAGGLQVADMGNAPADPTASQSPIEKAGDSTPASADIALAKPTQTSASTTPMASSEPVGGSAESATPQAHVASAAAPAAANHAAAAAVADPHFDPVDSAGAPRPDDATGPARPDLAQSFTPPVSANSPAPATAAPLTAAPATSSPLSPQAVPISGLAIEIAARATRDEKSFQIRLDPPELGRIDVQLNVDASGHVTTHLTVDRPETLNLLRQDASSLQRALESTGLKANSGGLEFSLRNHSSGGQGGGQRGGQSNGTTASVARIVVSDADMPAGQTATRGYARLLGVGTGVDIRV